MKRNAVHRSKILIARKKSKVKRNAVHRSKILIARKKRKVKRNAVHRSESQCHGEFNLNIHDNRGTQGRRDAAVANALSSVVLYLSYLISHLLYLIYHPSTQIYILHFSLTDIENHTIIGFI